MAAVREAKADLILLGPETGAAEPLTCLKRLRAAGIALPVLVLTPPGLPAEALEAVRAGADDALAADAPRGELAARLRMLERDLEARRARSEAEDLRGRCRELESLVYLISHDLWTPIVSIQGISSILLEPGTGLEGRPRDLATRIRANAERIEELVRDLMDFPKIGRLVGALEPVSSAEAAERAVEGLADRIQQFGAEVKVADGLPEVIADRKRLRQVFHNLLDNAVKYGGDPPRVEVGCRQDEGSHLFSVKDNGAGITPEDQEKAFHLFQRVGDTQRREGMGIGLAMVRQIVERHGGRIWCESIIGQGSTFYFTIPKQPAVEQAQPVSLQ